MMAAELSVAELAEKAAAEQARRGLYKGDLIDDLAVPDEVLDQCGPDYWDVPAAVFTDHSVCMLGAMGAAQHGDPRMGYAVRADFLCAVAHEIGDNLTSSAIYRYSDREDVTVDDAVAVFGAVAEKYRAVNAW